MRLALTLDVSGVGGEGLDVDIEQGSVRSTKDQGPSTVSSMEPAYHTCGGFLLVEYAAGTRCMQLKRVTASC